MKSLYKQVEFLDKKLLPIYGIKNIVDYNTVLYLDNLNDEAIKKINDLIMEFKQIFPVKNFNLHKTNYKIDSASHSFLFLKKILETTFVHFEYGTFKNKKYLRLIPKNNILEKYIENMNKTSEIRTFNAKTPILNQTKLNDYSYKFTNKDLLDNIKKQHKCEFILFPKNVIIDDNYLINIDSFGFKNEIVKNVNFCFVSNYDSNGVEILSKDYIANINKISRKVKIMVRGDHIEFDSNDGKIISDVFFNPLGKQEIKLYVQNHEKNNLDNILIKIDVTYVDFYTEFQNKLTDNCYIEQLININGLQVELLTIHGYTDIYRKNDSVKNKRLLEMGIIGHDEYIGTHKAFNCKSDHQNQGLLTLMSSDYDIAFVPPKVFTDFGYSYHIKSINNKKLFENLYFVSRHGDLIWNIKIITKHELNLNKTKFYFGEGNGSDIELLLKHNVIDNNNCYEYEVTNINKYNMINLLGKANGANKITAHVHSNVFKNYFNDSQIHISYCYTQMGIRKQLPNCPLTVNIAETQ